MISTPRWVALNVSDLSGVIPLCRFKIVPSVRTTEKLGIAGTAIDPTDIVAWLAIVERVQVWRAIGNAVVFDLFV